MSRLTAEQRGVLLSLLAIAGLILAASGVRLGEGTPPDDDPGVVAARPQVDDVVAPPPASRPGRLGKAKRPGVFDGRRFLVAYYGTAGTGALGVLGETSPDEMDRRLRRAAKAFERADQVVQPVYELIVTIADRHPGPDGDYSHDIERAHVEEYVEAARRNGALLLLDIQPGRSDFLEVAKRWRWALKEPHVGLALDPEWRMYGGSVPGSVIGTVTAAEVNRTTAWLAGVVAGLGLPQKLFVLHSFRTSMIQHVDRVRDRPRLAMVQHVDGFGTPAQKRATYRTVARPDRFVMGFKLFYDEDRPRMSSTDVHRLRPDVRFVSFQ